MYSPGKLTFLPYFTVAFIFLFCISSTAQEIESLKFDSLKIRYEKNNDTLYVINFWATWCKPCIEELPFFEECNTKFQNEKVKIILVNLDFNSKVNTVALPFLKKRNIGSKVIHVIDTDPNQWINKVDSSWSGAIPATLVIKNSKKLFFKEGSMTKVELEGIIEKHLK